MKILLSLCCLCVFGASAEAWDRPAAVDVERQFLVPAPVRVQVAVDRQFLLVERQVDRPFLLIRQPVVVERPKVNIKTVQRGPFGPERTRPSWAPPWPELRIACPSA